MKSRPSWIARSASAKASASLRQEDFGNAESIAGVAGDSTIVLSEGIGANHSTAGGSSSVPKRRDFSRPNAGISYYEDDSVMLWSDDPEREYFEYILQQEQENRAKQGKSAEDSLIGGSTVDEIQGPPKHQHQQSGEDSCQDGDGMSGTFDYNFPILSTYNNKDGGPTSDFGGFSLATTEKSKQESRTDEASPDLKGGAGKGTILPDYIYVADTSSEPVTNSSKKSSQEFFHARPKGRCFYIVVILLAGICLAGTTIAIYLGITHDKGGGTSSSAAAAIQGATAGTTNSPTMSQQTTTTTSLPSTTTFPTMPPSYLLQKKTPVPTRSAPTASTTTYPTFETTDETRETTKEPTAPPTVNPTGSPTRGPLQTEIIEPAPTPAPTRRPTERPSFKPTNRPTGEPTNRPTGKPTFRPTGEPTPATVTEMPPTSPGSASPPTTITCGCSLCSLVWTRIADEHSCGDRITYLIRELGYTEIGACRLVASVEFPTICGPCDPETCELGALPTPAAAPAQETPEPMALSANEAPPRPSLRPTARPTSQNLALVGDNDKPDGTFPLNRCEGDCDTDADCAFGLVCYQRDAFGPVPGCFDGDQDTSRTDYCIPASQSVSVVNTRTRFDGDDFFRP